ncbi:acetate--CoA ligase family protein [Actinomadura sp. SCN-SB]|uniref:acetate--CoA ligase family protein n=1 Tax=Actinomadura sp. SCN-SB TaxID=3373092 RepID=UPI0037538AA4
MPDSESLSRLLSPKSVAVVGASERRVMSNVAVGHLLDAPVTLHLVHPTAERIYGRPAVRDLSAIGEPVDAVLSLVSAERTVTVAEEAARLGCGGLVAVAGGFAEAGPDGGALQDRLVRAAGDGLAVCGPNCTGFANLTDGVSLFTGTPVDVPAGGISIVSSSGYLMRSAMVAAGERGLGVRLAISAGNEAVTTLVDYLDHLVADPATTVIAVIAERIADPAGFFAAAARAREAGKPLAVLKLGRGARAREIVRSHTGALTGESWVYDVALRAAGILVARDIEDLLDGVALLARLPRRSWRPVERVAVLASSGGVAALACDTVADEGIEIPPLDGIGARIRKLVPGAEVVNPLDLTGFAMTDPDALAAILRAYHDCDEVDAVVVCWWLGPDDERRAAMLLDPARGIAAAGTKPVVMTTVENSRIGSWTAGGRDGVVFGRGLKGTFRGLHGMHRHVTARRRDVPARTARIPRPEGIIEGAAGPMLTFAESMRLLAAEGIPVAPWTVLERPGDWEAGRLPGVAGRLVVKLADVPHRTEYGAVRLGVEPDAVPAAAAELSALAAGHGLPRTIAVQVQVAGEGEAFIGCQGETDLGPVVVAGLGGTLVELNRTVAGRPIPVDDRDVEEMLDELGRDTVFAGLRGGRAWNRPALAAAVLASARLMERAAGWAASIDLNPVVCGPGGCSAVDALVLVKP